MDSACADAGYISRLKGSLQRILQERRIQSLILRICAYSPSCQEHNGNRVTSLAVCRALGCPFMLSCSYDEGVVTLNDGPTGSCRPFTLSRRSRIVPACERIALSYEELADIHGVGSTGGDVKLKFGCVAVSRPGLKRLQELHS